MALFVLGAGATRGASFVNPANNPCLPPLDLELCAHVIPFPNGDLPFPNGDIVRADPHLLCQNAVDSETSSTSDQH